MEPWKTKKRSIVFHHGKFLTVENHVVELPDGRLIEDWAWIVTPDFVNVIAVTVDNKILCFRQVKYAVEGTTLAPVGGHIDTGEDPLDAAQRELLEETGYKADHWHYLGGFRTMANRGGGMGHAYLACRAHKTTEPSSDDLEEQELHFLDLNEVEDALVQGEFKVFSWAASVALALMRLKRGLSAD